MAKQPKGQCFTGTLGGITFYVVDGVGYARSKSSLTAKRVLKDKAFEKTRRCARDLGLASKIASPIYRALPLEEKGRWLFRAIAGEAASLLYEGKTQEQVNEFLWNKYIYAPLSITEDKTDQSGETVHSFASKQTTYALWKIFRDRWDAQDKPVYVFKQIWERRGKFRSEKIPRTLGIVPAV